MSHNKRYKRLCAFLLIVCVLIQAGLAMPFLSQVWVLNTLGRSVEPSFVASLYECQQLTPDNLKQFRYLEEGLINLFSYLKFHPTKPFFISIYYRYQRSLIDHRDNIKYLIMSHFHGSRYKDVNPQSIFF